MNTIKLWMPLRLGIAPKDPLEIRQAIQRGLIMSVPDCIYKHMMLHPSFQIVPEEMEVDLVRGSAADFGFGDGYKVSDLYVGIQGAGMELCLPEVGPRLRYAYKNQPVGEELRIGMEPIRGRENFLWVFEVSHLVRRDPVPDFMTGQNVEFQACWLDEHCVSPHGRTLATDEWVFVLPRPTK